MHFGKPINFMPLKEDYILGKNNGNNANEDKNINLINLKLIYQFIYQK